MHRIGPATARSGESECPGDAKGPSSARRPSRRCGGIAFVEGGTKGRKRLARYLEDKRATWPQVLSGSPQWYSEPFEAYDVRYLPLHLLLDAEGRLVEVNPRGERLNVVLRQLLGDP